VNLNNLPDQRDGIESDSHSENSAGCTGVDCGGNCGICCELL